MLQLDGRKSKTRKPTYRVERPRNRRWQPWLECLEDRTLLSGAANHFAVLSLPSTVAGLPAPVEAVALDAANDRVLDYRGTVHITSSDSSALLPGDYTFTANDRGAHLF